MVSKIEITEGEAANFSKVGNNWLDLELLPCVIIVGSLTVMWQCSSPTKAIESDCMKIVVRCTYYMIMQWKQLDLRSFVVVPCVESELISSDESKKIT